MESEKRFCKCARKQQLRLQIGSLLFVLVASVATDHAVACADSTLPEEIVTRHITSKYKILESFITDRFEIIDANFDTGFIAFRHVYHVPARSDDAGEPWHGGSVNCRYAGMSKHPTSGVLLGVWNLITEQLEEIFHIYPAALYAEGCLPHAASLEVLSDAKEFLASKALDSTGRVYLKESLMFRIGDRCIEMGAVAKRVPDDEPVVINGHNIRWHGPSTLLRLKLSIQDHVFYQSYRYEDRAMASFGELSVPGAIRVRNQLVFVERFSETHYHGGGWVEDNYAFSPIFDMDKLVAISRAKTVCEAQEE